MEGLATALEWEEILAQAEQDREYRALVLAMVEAELIKRGYEV